MDFVIVAGMPRSGGSALAEVLHTLGVHMGSLFPAPAAPSYRCEWEDLDLVQMLHDFNLDGVVHESERLGRVGEYVSDRARAAQILNEHTGETAVSVGIKSPLVIPYLDLFRAAIAGWGMRCVLLCVERPLGECYASARACLKNDPPALAEFLETMDRLAGIVPTLGHSMIVDHRALMLDPLRVVRALAAVLDDEFSEERMIDAASRVGRKEGVGCPQSGER